MPGAVVAVKRERGAEVEAGTVSSPLEALKMGTRWRQPVALWSNFSSPPAIMSVGQPLARIP